MHDVHPSLGPTDLSHWLPSRKILKDFTRPAQDSTTSSLPRACYSWLASVAKVLTWTLLVVGQQVERHTESYLLYPGVQYKQLLQLTQAQKPVLQNGIPSENYSIGLYYCYCVWHGEHWWQAHVAPWLWWYKPSSGGWGVKVGRENGSTTCRKSRFIDSLDVYVHQLPTHVCWTNRSNSETQKVQKHHQLMNTSGCAVTFYFLPPSCYQNLFQEFCLWKKRTLHSHGGISDKHQLASLSSRVTIGIKNISMTLACSLTLKPCQSLKFQKMLLPTHAVYPSQISHTDWLESMNVSF